MKEKNSTHGPDQPLAQKRLEREWWRGHGRRKTWEALDNGKQEPSGMQKL
jgi:hypothetical protein